MVSAEDELAGFYTLSTSQIPVSEIPNRYRKGVSKFSFPFPAVLIGQFAINKVLQGKKLSYCLLGDAYTRIAMAYKQSSIGFRAIRVDTRNDKARDFWLKQNFIPFKKTENSLFMPVQTILQELES